MMTTNTSGIQPVEYNVLVKPKIVEEKTAGGIYIPEQRREKEQFAQQEGVLVAVSPLAFTYEEWPAGSRLPRVGDQVLFLKYQAEEVKGLDGEKYWLMKDKAIAAIMEAAQ